MGTIHIKQVMRVVGQQGVSETLVLPTGHLVAASVGNLGTANQNMGVNAVVQYVDQNGNEHELASGYTGSIQDRSVTWTGRLPVRVNDTLRFRMNNTRFSSFTADLSAIVEAPPVEVKL